MTTQPDATAAQIEALRCDFVPEARAIELQEPPASGRWTLYALLALIVAALAWASLSHIDRLVTGHGRLVAPTANVTVRPLEPGLLKSLNVRVGQVVRRGDVLATLDATFAGSDARQLDSRREKLALQSQRLQRELAGDHALAPSPASGPASTLSRDQQRLQAELLAERQATFDARMRQFDQNVARLKAALETNRQDQKALAQRVATLEELEKMQSDLEASQFVSRAQRLEIQDKRLEVQRDRTAAIHREQEILREIAAVDAERATFVRSWRQDAMEKLSSSVQERDEVTEQANKARLRSALVTLVAPEDAVVLEIGKVSVGAVVRDGEPLLVLVPIGHALEAEIEIGPDDVAELRVGDTTRIKLDAYPFQKHGTATGRVLSISPDAFTRPGPLGSTETYYLARVALEDTRLDGLKAPPRLLPGMTLAGEVITGERRVISYFLYPIIRTLDESLRER
jgi:HlyD family secretion protein